MEPAQRESTQTLEQELDALLEDFDRIERDPTPQPERHRELRRRRITDKLKNLLELLNEQTRTAVVLIHGGSWNSGDRWDLAPAARDLAERGFVAATIDYRLAGVARFPAAVADARRAVLWLAANGARFGLDPRRIGVFGPSAG